MLCSKQVLPGIWEIDYHYHYKWLWKIKSSLGWNSSVCSTSECSIASLHNQTASEQWQWALPECLKQGVPTRIYWCSLCAQLPSIEKDFAENAGALRSVDLLDISHKCTAKLGAFWNSCQSVKSWINTSLDPFWGQGHPCMCLSTGETSCLPATK